MKRSLKKVILFFITLILVVGITSSGIAQAATNKLKISQKSVLLEPRETIKLSVKDSKNKVVTAKWSSTDIEVVTVNTKGKVTAVGVGEAIIVAKVGELTAKCNVEVVDGAAEGAPSDPIPGLDDVNDAPKAQVTLTFDSRGGSEIAPIIVDSYSAIEEMPVPTREHYIFKGWYLGDSYKSSVHVLDMDGSEYGSDIETFTGLPALICKGGARYVAVESATLYAWWGTEYCPEQKYIINGETITLDKVIEKAQQDLAAVITDNMTDYEKVKAVYDMMARNMEYDYSVIGRENAWAFPQYYATGAIMLGRTVCGGYADAFDLYMDLLGIECRYVDNPGVHAWNMVKVDGEWYHVDITLDDVDNNKVVEYNYFLKSTAKFQSIKYFSSAHKFNTTLYPECSSTKYD